MMTEVIKHILPKVDDMFRIIIYHLADVLLLQNRLFL